MVGIIFSRSLSLSRTILDFMPLISMIVSVEVFMFWVRGRGWRSAIFVEVVVMHLSLSRHFVRRSRSPIVVVVPVLLSLTCGHWRRRSVHVNMVVIVYVSHVRAGCTR